MDNSMQENGESRSTPTEMPGAIGTGGDAAPAAVPTVGATADDLTTSPTSAKRNTGKGRKPPAELPVSDLLSIFQEATRALQSAGLPVSVVNLPVSPEAAPRVAVILANCRLVGGDLVLANQSDTGNAP